MLSTPTSTEFFHGHGSLPISMEESMAVCADYRQVLQLGDHLDNRMAELILVMHLERLDAQPTQDRREVHSTCLADTR